MAPAISDIGTCTVSLILFDGINNVPYTPIKIVTSAPSSDINNILGGITASLSNIGPPLYNTILTD